MESDIEPAADGVVGRVFPRLQAVAMAEIVGRLLIVKCLIAVLDGGKSSGNHIGDEEAVECRDWFDAVWTRLPTSREGYC